MRKVWSSLSLAVGLVCISFSIFIVEVSANENNRLDELLDKLNESENVNVKFKENGTFSIAGNPNAEEQVLIETINDLYISGESTNLYADWPVVQDTSTANDGNAHGGTRISATLNALDWTDYSGYSGGSWLGNGTPSFIEISTTITHSGGSVLFNIPFGFTIGSSKKEATVKHAPEYNVKSFQETYKRPGVFVEGGWGVNTKVTQTAAVEIRINGHGYNAYPTVGLR